jgi:hypothetical protein
MRRRTLSEKLAIAASLLAASCTSDHRVSPWGGQAGPSFAAFAPKPDLEARLGAIDAETGALGLTRSFDLRVELPRKNGPAVLRGYEGQDVGGRPVHAVRVAAPLGVVMAVGPLDVHELDRRAATQIVPALVGGGAKGDEAGAFRSGTDLNGDGLLDVVLRNDAGQLAIWHFDALGSGAYAIAMEAPPTRGVDIDDDGRVDLEGELPVAPEDAIAPRLGDVATFAAGRYSNTTPAARAWHARRARAATAPAGARDDARLRAAIERAWHTILAGERSVETVLEALRKESVPARLRASFDRHLRVIAALPPIR